MPNYVVNCNECGIAKKDNSGRFITSNRSNEYWICDSCKAGLRAKREKEEELRRRINEEADRELERINKKYSLR